MHLKSLAVAAFSLVSTFAAQRPTGSSICDYYTTALFKDNNASNQQKLLIRIVNRVLVGNTYDRPTSDVVVNGILREGSYNGIKVKLLPYFNGGFVSTNGGNKPLSVNFLDGGGANVLRNNQPANSDKSNQYFLLTHLYQYFGVLLSCSKQGGAEFPGYSGSASQYNVHKFMYLSDAEVGYFIEQVALSAASFGVSSSDLTIIDSSLRQSFGSRCLPPMTIIPNQGSQLQSICTDDSCPLASNNTCASYDQTIAMPKSEACYAKYMACLHASNLFRLNCELSYYACKSNHLPSTNRDSTISKTQLCRCEVPGFSSGAVSVPFFSLCPCPTSGIGSNSFSKITTGTGSSIGAGSITGAAGRASTTSTATGAINNTGPFTRTSTSNGTAVQTVINTIIRIGNITGAPIGSITTSASNERGKIASTVTKSNAFGTGIKANNIQGTITGSGTTMGIRTNNSTRRVTSTLTMINGADSRLGLGSTNNTNSTVTIAKPTQVTAGAATIGLSFVAIAGGLAAYFL
ncbi:hypothetical protein BOTCAL_0311g00020 [Botryotinia calthae]|uniref:Uncharacterized protein n=1 Tax=Botryotinia calthae TaxID=38488 RepID=A0A4Y8CWR6_9HELO|nr:hypothetical protein BOTCAL_0311g00020 [Botryotinia calthae]